MNEDKLISLVLKNTEDIQKIKETMATKDDIRGIQGTIDKMVDKLIDHDDRLQNIEESMATKEDVRGIQNTLDTMLGMMKKQDHESTMTRNGMKRHEERIEDLEEDVRILKPLAGLA